MAVESASPSSLLDQLRKGGASKGPYTIAQSRALEGQPNSDLPSNATGVVDVNACARPRPFHKSNERRPTATPSDPYCVEGKPYLDSEKIPGNEPVRLDEDSGQPVKGPDGKDVYGPKRGVDGMNDIAKQLDSRWTSWGRKDDLSNFGTGKVWDFQRVHDDDGSIIYTDKYKYFSNIIIGYADAHGHLPSTEWIANQYARRNSNFKEPMSSDYPNLPERDVKDYEIGRKLRVGRPTK